MALLCRVNTINGRVYRDDPTSEWLAKHMTPLCTTLLYCSFAHRLPLLHFTSPPAVFAWDLVNEPRCYKCGDTLAQWVAEMAAFVKGIDSNHLLTVGEEGFYPQNAPQSAANPQGLQSWAFYEGQSFVDDHASADIDFMAIHLWVRQPAAELDLILMPRYRATFA